MRRIVIASVYLLAAACGSPQSGEDAKAAQAPPTVFDGALVTKASARVAHGMRIADVLGCTGCHGDGLEGKRFYELYASNLTRDVPNYSDEQLERLLRHGEHPTGRDVWGMPSEVFQHLSDADVAALVAYLRSLPAAGQSTQPHLPFEAETRQMIAEGKLKPTAQWVREVRATTPVDLESRHALGRYISRVTCAECHGPKLDGNEGDTPDLIAVGAYSREEFERLMVEGVPTGGRTLKPLMVEVARQRFAPMTPHERDALYAYLVARAEQPR